MVFGFVGLDAVSELDALDDSGRFVVAVETAPGLAGGHDQLEDHRQHGPVREATLAANGSMSDRGEHALDEVRGPDALPVLRREAMEREQRLAISPGRQPPPST